MDEMPKVTEDRLDMLREMANIGVGSAATSLSAMLNEEKITMDVPQVAVEPIQEIPEHLGAPEDAVGGVYIESINEDTDIDLILLFVLSLSSVRYLIKRLLPPENTTEEMELSLLTEVGNIVAGSYLSALSFMTDRSFQSSPPKLAVDMAGAIVGTIIAETVTTDDYLILLKTTIQTEQEDIEGTVLILPNQGALDSLFNLMGVE